ncbi:cytochrome P450 superfamily protein [Parafrankia sp. EAN1pec]|uniref:cytochrome P450 n=1 Tax=Parafrankia sp. (strain EAN1pec) TaxID=298653 RepID=UPI00005445C4|nr:cytochrome P450 superfamily protein [Frankia sp. EAN1pec]
MAQTGTERPLIPLQIDPPKHREYRRILDPLFSPQRMKEMEGPITELARGLVDWESPVMMVARFATQDTEIAGCPVRKGQVVTDLLGAANTDEREIPEPEAVRFNRDANRHIAFGRGPHRCLGSHLARLELRIALREWHARIPDYRVPDGFQPAFTTTIRSLVALPLQLDPSA